MVRVEFIAGDTEIDFEEKLNEWLGKNENVKITDINPKFTYDKVAVFYEVVKKQKLNKSDRKLKKAVGERIKEERLRRGLTLEEFGKLFNASRASVWGWEEGKFLPSDERIEQLSELLDISVSELTSL